MITIAGQHVDLVIGEGPGIRRTTAPIESSDARSATYVGIGV